tara:strand:- start:1800 stop:2744 length:945 start_codon:yes stop_codon:yes gene_type:complete
MPDNNTFDSDKNRRPDQVLSPRAKRIWRKAQLIELQPSNLENIDASIYEWLNETLDIHCTKNSGWEKVPIIWAGAERTLQSKRSPDDRKQDGSLVYPLITIERTSVAKDPTKKGIYYGNIPPTDDYRQGSLVISKKINQDKTANFANADARRFGGTTDSPVKKGVVNFKTKRGNKKIVYETLSVPMPVYLDIEYSINLRTEYQQQMNEIVQPFMVYTGGINHFVVERNSHRYECFIQADFTQDNNISSMAEEARKYETKVTIKTLGYVFGSGDNQESPKITRRENAVEFKIARERVIMEDTPEYVDASRAKYRS